MLAGTMTALMLVDVIRWRTEIPAVSVTMELPIGQCVAPMLVAKLQTVVQRENVYSPQADNPIAFANAALEYCPIATRSAKGVQITLSVLLTNLSPSVSARTEGFSQTARRYRGRNAYALMGSASKMGVEENSVFAITGAFRQTVYPHNPATWSTVEVKNVQCHIMGPNIVSKNISKIVIASSSSIAGMIRSVLVGLERSVGRANLTARKAVIKEKIASCSGKQMIWSMKNVFALMEAKMESA